MQAYCAHFIVCCVWELAHSAVVCTEKNVVGMSSRKERQLRQHHGSCMYTVLRCTTLHYDPFWPFLVWWGLEKSLVKNSRELHVSYLSCSPQKDGIIWYLQIDTFTYTKIGVYLPYKKCQNAALCTALCAAAVWPKGGNRGQPERTSPVMLRLKLSVIDGNLPGKAGLAHFSSRHCRKKMCSMFYLQVTDWEPFKNSPWSQVHYLKFRYSEKATKIWKYLPILFDVS